MVTCSENAKVAEQLLVVRTPMTGLLIGDLGQWNY